MKEFYLYADSESQAVLSDESEKILLIGGDLGYGNFGDILQHANALRITKGHRRFRTVSIMSMEVISSERFPAWARQSCQTDAIIFVSSVRQRFDQVKAQVDPVRHLRNISGLYLYGGGFLNANWGDFMLGVTEHFLNHLPNVTYFVSGQQVSSPFESVVVQHVAEYKPVVFGCRDLASLRLLQDKGFAANFSFDDATELLQPLGQRLLRKTSGNALVHLNISDYTGNEESLKQLGKELAAVGAALGNEGSATLIQAFRDRRECVRDTRETIKSLEIDFPFADYRLLELPAFCYPGRNVSVRTPVEGALGYSCSYHVALWLQLAGIPCYLRKSNPYYDQKSEALGIHQSLSDFLASPTLSDHRTNLEQRKVWMKLLDECIDDMPTVANEANLEAPGEVEEA